MMRIAILLTLTMMFSGWKSSPTLFQMQEICDNALDDDQDGLIDLNDPDCDCPILEPKSLIPNPSFEDSLCCPPARSSLECAETWIQASAATTDYLHTCGWMGWHNLVAPTPFPDGEACIGFRNGRFNRENPDDSNPNWKEYTGACLSEPLRVGNTYRLEFHIGFTALENSPPINITLFGTSDCNKLPFGLGNEAHGCPLNGSGWIQLESEYAAGENNWQKEAFQITPEQDIYAIAIGPDCPVRTSEPNTYYFLDNLILADIREFEFVISEKNNPCSDEFSLKLPRRDSLKYQWYLDGIALPGETEPELTTYVQDGTYQVQLQGPLFCQVTKPHFFRRSVLKKKVIAPLCPGASFDFHGKVLFEEGIYCDTLKTADGCDSIVELDLRDAISHEVDVDVKIFDGESLEIGSLIFNETTTEEVLLKSSKGCDSTVNLSLKFYQVFAPNAFTPNGDGRNDVFEIKGGPDLLDVTYLAIVDRWGGEMFRNNPDSDGNLSWDGTTHGEVAQPGSYIYVADVVMDDLETRRISGVVHLVQ